MDSRDLSIEFCKEWSSETTLLEIVNTMPKIIVNIAVIINF